MPDRSNLSKALVLLVAISRDFTRLAASTLGSGNTGNRQVQILLFLHENPGVTPSRLAQVLRMSRSSLSHALARFEQELLISRSVDAADRRSVRLSLTSPGNARVLAFEQALAGQLSRSAPAILACLELLGVPAAAASKPPVLGAVSVGKQLTKAGEAYVDEVSAAVRPFGVFEATDRFALALINDAGGMRPAQLSEALGMSSSGTSTLLDRLEAAGLVLRGQRAEELDDRRAVLVRLTRKGAAAADIGLSTLSGHSIVVAEALGQALGQALARRVP